ncbi:MAG: transglycosylase domain-containing protein [Leptospiraceae bacterium]|nr:transglycosylase domain-containing protein [Leptospiraceae bacterium]
MLPVFAAFKIEAARQHGDTCSGSVVEKRNWCAWQSGPVFQEDRKFYSHAGFNSREIRIAFMNWLWHDRPLRGASTITQQLARSLFLSPRRSIGRKLMELRLAQYLERRFSKKGILYLYLNTAYLGAGTYGIQSASFRFWGKQAEDLNPAEIAFVLAHLPQPDQCPSAAQCRSKVLLSRAGRLQNAIMQSCEAR